MKTWKIAAPIPSLGIQSLTIRTNAVGRPK